MSRIQLINSDFLLKNLFVLTALFISYAGSAQTIIGKQNLVNLNIGNGQTTQALVYTTADPVATVFFFYGLGHETSQPNSVLIDQGPAEIIAKGWKPNFNVISVRVPGTDGYFYSEDFPGHKEAINFIIADALSKYGGNPNKIILMGISAGGGAIGNYLLEKNFTAQFQISAAALMSATLSSSGSSVNLSVYDLNKVIGKTGLWGEGNTQNDIQGAITKSLVDAMNNVKPGSALYTGITAACKKQYDNCGHNHDAWYSFYDSTSQFYNWALNFSANNVITPPADTTKKDTAVVTAHKWYPKKDAAGGINLNQYAIQAGDSVFVDGTQSPYTQISWKYFKGDSMNTVKIVRYKADVYQTNNPSFPFTGFDLTGTTGVKISGFGPDSSLGWHITSYNKTGVGFSLKERSANIEIEGTEEYNVTSAGFYKIETQDDNNADSLRAFNFYLHGLNVHHNYWHNTSAEGWYIGSTASNGTKGTQHQDIYWNGILDTSFPPHAYDIKVTHNKSDSTGRAAIQVTNTDADTTSEIAFNTVLHAGSDPDIYQGDGISLGSYFKGSCHDNYINFTKKYGIEDHASLARIYNNTILNSGNSGLGTTSNATSIYVSSQDLRFFSPIKGNDDSTRFYIYNNIVDDTIFVEYGIGVYAKGNLIANNKAKVFVRPGINYSTGTNKILRIDTSFIKQHVPLQKVAPFAKNIHQFINENGKLASRVDTTRPYYYTKDTVIKVPVYDTVFATSQTKIGIAPIAIAQAYHSSVTRDEINYQYWQQQPAAIKRIAAYDADSVIITITNRNADLSPAKFIIDTSAFKNQLLQIYYQTHKKYFVIENENDNPKYYNDATDNYINELIAAVHALAPLGVKIYNGGFIAIRLWYFDKTKDSDFFKTCLTASQQYNYSKGLYQDVIASTQKQIDAFKKLAGFTAFNFHNFYFTSSSEFPGMKRLVDYFRKNIGDVITNEMGVYSADATLPKQVADFVRSENLEWGVFYSGDGSGPALPITEENFNNSIKI